MREHVSAEQSVVSVICRLTHKIAAEMYGNVLGNMIYFAKSNRVIPEIGGEQNGDDKGCWF